MASGHRAGKALNSLKIRAPRDFWGGVALIALAVIAFWATRDLGGMQGVAFGPGTAPRLFSGLLGVIGCVVMATGLLTDGPPIEKFALRGPAFVLAAIVAFAAMMQGIVVPPLGLVLSAFAAFMISISGSREMRWVESLIAAAAMTTFCVVLFSYVLKLPFPLWPAFML
ncbi:MAG TPA: tripartite tricarboxylate transporter TctB family protein [Pseudolabrys sp.]|nr:tripartite tricarboxylate transporter TctB family protein [Pseudolabrys sp.]